MARKPRHDYDALKAAYALTPSSVSDTQFAKKHNIPLRTLQAKKRQDAKNGEPWERNLTDAVKSKTKLLQQRVAAGLDVNQPITDETVAIATAATTNFLVLEKHERMFSKSMDSIEKGLELLSLQQNQGILVVKKRGKITEGDKATEEIDVEADYVAKTLNQLTGALERVVKMQRHHIGIDNEDAGASYEDDLEALAAAMDADDS